MVHQGSRKGSRRMQACARGKRGEEKARSEEGLTRVKRVKRARREEAVRGARRARRRKRSQ
jgi:hypothetical protein